MTEYLFIPKAIPDKAQLLRYVLWYNMYLDKNE